jgi:hypothetical protein
MAGTETATMNQTIGMTVQTIIRMTVVPQS